MASLLTLLLFLPLLFHGAAAQPDDLPQPDNPPRGPSPAGTWSLLHKSIGISAMHMQLLHTDEVVIFDRTDSGPSNISLPLPLPPGCAKYDCTAHSVVYSLASGIVRPVTVQTDTFCSSGAVLPNGTLLQTGGFKEGDRAIRLFDPSPGSNWVEQPGYLAARRWYASDQILPDGRVIVVGGRRQFNYEFYPKPLHPPSAPPVQLRFLVETNDRNAENNLYPFLHLLPDGNLLIFANTRAIVLDYVKNLVVRSLPPIPGEDPRNYPSTGSSALLPLRLPTDGSANVEAELLVCGGAPRGSFQGIQNGTFRPALRTCGRITATDPAAQWRMEEMPLARIMGDMLLLPTGDVLIINGAGKGTAGWENGREPVNTPVLYRPYFEPARRFKEMNGSTIARMYHSTALVDSYGRVLVGGSNPHVKYNFSAMYPTDLSLEAFYPPYLNSYYDPYRPNITVVGPSNVLVYRQKVEVKFELKTYLPLRGVEVVMMAPAFVTHSNSMSQRLVVLPVGMVKPEEPFTYRISTAMPPTPTIAPPGWYVMFVVHAKVPSKGVWVKIH